MTKYLYVIIFCTYCCFGQTNPEIKRATHWYFGNRAGLDFSSGTAVADTNGKLYSDESCAAISDTAGNLLFYTNGVTIWDRNHNVMPNGIGLFGCISSVQGSIIIPQPNSTTLFYVFTLDCAENLGAKGMNYSIVDLSLNAGFGDVILKNQLLFTPNSEAMAATMNCSRDSIWVVGHEYGTNAFYAYLITENGLNITPVISNIGTPVNVYESQMKFSPNNKKVACYLDLFDFNFSNGTLSNSIQLPLTGYGTSFSSDSKKLYISSSGNLIVQLDATKSNSVDIANSYQIIYNGPDNSEYLGLQLSIDHKIYIASPDATNISTIDNPNNFGINANFNPYSVSLNNKICQGTFPSFIESYFDDSYNKNNCYTTNDTIGKDDLIIPNIFTSNNDGVNDVFTIEVKGYISFTYFIFNRWGTCIKKDIVKLVSNNAHYTLWDGTINSEPASDGVYYYIIELTDKKNTSVTKKGYLQLLR